MLCIRPFERGAIRFGCGQCLPCRINKRREWATRILLESYGHGQSAFATLTYAKEPEGGVSPRELQLFFKRLRKKFAYEIRYFAVGEYGDRTQRAHYHAALFGVCPVLHAGLVQQAWSRVVDGEHQPIGGVHLGEINHKTAEYIGGYICKKATRIGDERLDGRHPEFARMSRGLGKAAVPQIAAQLMTEKGSLALLQTVDVPGQVRVDKKFMPVGRFLKGQIRQAIGWDKEVPEGFKALLKVKEDSLSKEDKAQRERDAYGRYLAAKGRMKVAQSKKRV